MLSIVACQQAEKADERRTVASAPLREFLQAISVSPPVPKAMIAGETVTVPVTVKNIGKETWPAGQNGEGSLHVTLGSRWLDKSGQILSVGSFMLPSDVEPGKSLSLDASITVPRQAGHLTLRLTMIQQGVAWFEERGAKPLDTPVTVTAR
jgi:hypothetical protein